MATALGCLPSAIDDEPVINIFRLLEYWAEHPPEHISLAAQMAPRGGGSAPPSSKPAHADIQAGMAELAAMAGPMMKRAAPDGFSDVLQWVEEKEAKLKAGG